MHDILTRGLSSPFVEADDEVEIPIEFNKFVFDCLDCVEKERDGRKSETEFDCAELKPKFAPIEGEEVLFVGNSFVDEGDNFEVKGDNFNDTFVQIDANIV